MSADNDPDHNPDYRGPDGEGPDSDTTENDDPADQESEEDLFVNGWFYPDGDVAVELKRGMAILGREGREAGKVAAVILDRRRRRVTHFLLGHLSQHLEYRRVPIELIVQVRDGSVLLRIDDAAFDRLPRWRGS